MAAGKGHQGLERRLVCGVADSLRALGAARMVARQADGAGPTVALLRSAGFVPAGAGRAPLVLARPGLACLRTTRAAGGNWSCEDAHGRRLRDA